MVASNVLQNRPVEGANADKFREMVAELAYLKAEKRGFAAGYDMDDWLEAEQEISSRYHDWFQHA
jgi:hypothetical protein